MSFLKYYELKEDVQISNKFDNLCESIANYGVDFDQFWTEIGLPIMLESYAFRSPEQLLEGMFDGLGSKLKSGFQRGVSSLMGNPGQPQVNRQDPGLGSFGKQQRVLPANTLVKKPDPKQQRLNQEQGNVDKITQHIKAKFANAMQNFLSQVQGDANQKNSPYMWQVAKMLNDKLTGYVEKDFLPKVKYGDGGWKKDFEKQRVSNYRLPRALSGVDQPAKSGNVLDMRATADEEPVQAPQVQAQTTQDPNNPWGNYQTMPVTNTSQQPQQPQPVASKTIKVDDPNSSAAWKSVAQQLNMPTERLNDKNGRPFQGKVLRAKVKEFAKEQKVPLEYPPNA